jgi:hypothetical protein
VRALSRVPQREDAPRHCLPESKPRRVIVWAGAPRPRARAGARALFGSTPGLVPAAARTRSPLPSIPPKKFYWRCLRAAAVSQGKGRWRFWLVTEVRIGNATFRPDAFQVRFLSQLEVPRRQAGQADFGWFEGLETRMELALRPGRGMEGGVVTMDTLAER